MNAAPRRSLSSLAGKRQLCSLVVLLTALSSLAGSAAAANAPSQSPITQTYNAGPSVLPAMLVTLKPQDSSTVIPLTSQNLADMLGVVVPTSGAAIVLSPQNSSTQQVLVATAGRYDLLVSNQNGSIETGDPLTISALDGIAMKAGTTQPQIVGRAAGNFSGTSGAIGTETLKGSLSNTTVAIGYVPAEVQLAPNPLFQQKQNNLPGWLNKAAQSVADKPVSPAKVYISVAILLATIGVAGSMFYGGVRSGIVAIGRNPLAKGVISRGLLQTMLAGLIVVIAGLLGVYALLNL